MELELQHKMAAHCEDGVISTLLQYYGVEMSEPMIFGLSSGLFFAHMPFVKMGGMPVTAFRTWPGVFFKRISKQLGIEIGTERFLNQQHSMQAVDQKLAEGTPVGCVVGMYYLSYMPKEYRFHFNGHNICVCGKDEESDEYIISDPIVLDKTRLSARYFQRARFAKGGTYPVLGQMYWIKKMPEKFPDLRPLIISSILKNCDCMIGYPKFINFAGTNAIRLLSSRIKSWEKKMNEHQLALNIAQIVRMQEEIGTGGAGFRFLYGAFLQEAAKVTGIEELNQFAMRITDIGDLWREFAAMATRIVKKRKGVQYTFDDVSAKLKEIADLETVFFQDLYKAVKANA